MESKFENLDEASMSSPPESGESAEAQPGSPLAKLEGEEGDNSTIEFEDPLFDPLSKEDRLVFDSTSAVEISVAVEGDKGEAAGDPKMFLELEDYCKQPIDKNTALAELDRGTGLQRKWQTITNKYWSRCSATHTKYMLLWGKVWGRMYRLVDTLGLRWDRWVENNFGPRSIRTVEDWRRLARIPSIEKYAYLGKARLMLIVSALGKIEGNDPIKDLKEEYSIPLDPGEDIPLCDIQEAIEGAVILRRLEKAKIKVDTELIQKLVRLGAHKNAPLVRDVVIIKNSNGDVNDYLHKLYAKKGELDNTLRGLTEPQKKLEHFNRAGSKMKELVKEIDKDVTLLEEINLDLLRELIEQLTALRTKRVG